MRQSPKPETKPVLVSPQNKTIKICHRPITRKKDLISEGASAIVAIALSVFILLLLLLLLVVFACKKYNGLGISQPKEPPTEDPTVHNHGEKQRPDSTSEQTIQMNIGKPHHTISRIDASDD
jgi:hypothetical protein